MIEQIEVWSKEKQKIVMFDVALVDEIDDGENKASVLMLSNGDEKYRFSPNTTEEELLKQVDQMNKEKA